MPNGDHSDQRLPESYRPPHAESGRPVPASSDARRGRSQVGTTARGHHARPVPRVDGRTARVPSVRVSQRRHRRWLLRRALVSGVSFRVARHEIPRRGRSRMVDAAWLTTTAIPQAGDRRSQAASCRGPWAGGLIPSAASLPACRRGRSDHRRRRGPRAPTPPRPPRARHLTVGAPEQTKASRLFLDPVEGLGGLVGTFARRWRPQGRLSPRARPSLR